MVFFLGTYIAFWTLVFILPTPHVYDKYSFIETLNLTDKEKLTALPQILDSFKSSKVNDNFFFEQDLDKKRGSSIFLASIYTFVLMFIFIIAFHKRSYIVFPITAALVVSLILYSVIWTFNFSISPNVYIDLQNIIIQNQGIKALQFLGLYIFFLVFILLFGSWYKLPK